MAGSPQREISFAQERQELIAAENSKKQKSAALLALLDDNNCSTVINTRVVTLQRFSVDEPYGFTLRHVIVYPPAWTDAKVSTLFFISGTMLGQSLFFISGISSI